jgi:glycosyltransferase involved in cell wall biosynthesis
MNMMCEPHAVPSPPPPGVPRFVFVGRITPIKGLSWLVSALGQTEKSSILDVVGDGPAMGTVVALSKRLKLSDRVVFHGWQPMEVINKRLRESRALVLPSVWHEPGGTVAFESLMLGRAVISSRVGGMPEIVQPGRTGALVEPNDVKALASEIDGFAEDYERASAIGLRGYELVSKNYTVGCHVARLINVFRLAAGDKESRVT